MLKVCEIFGEEFGMQFNPKKSVCVHFSRTPNITPRMTLAGKELSWVKRVKHLGHYLSQDLSSQYEIQMKRSDLVGRSGWGMHLEMSCRQFSILSVVIFMGHKHGT